MEEYCKEYEIVRSESNLMHVFYGIHIYIYGAARLFQWFLKNQMKVQIKTDSKLYSKAYRKLRAVAPLL